MPIVDVSTEYEEVEDVQEQPVYVSKEELKTSTLYNKDNSLDRILPFIRGNRWQVDYFLQLRDMNDTIAQPDINVPVSMQKYHRIDKLELVVQNAISQEDIENISGEAIVNVGMTPNTYDVFKATLTGGREALFLVTEVSKKTYNLHETYVIGFKIFTFIDGSESNTRIWNNIVEKTMKTYVYDKDHLLDYSAPVILASDYKKKVELRTELPNIIDYYMRTFVNYDKNVIALPTTVSVYTDLYLNKFINSILDQTDHEIMARLSNLSFTPGEDNVYTIWDVILRRDTRLLKLAIPRIEFRYTPFSYTGYLSKKMNYLGINFLATPVEDDAEISIPLKDISAIRDEGYTEPIAERVKHYVMSEHFYKLDTEKCGYLEELLIKYLKSDIINSDDLDKPIMEYTSWSTMDQYYLIPVLMVLIRECIANTFKSI